MAGAPDDLAGGVAMMSAPPAPFIPEPLHGAALVAVLAAWTGAPEDAGAAIAPLRATRPLVDAGRPVPYAVLQGIFESPEPFIARMHGGGGFVRELDGDVWPRSPSCRRPSRVRWAACTCSPWAARSRACPRAARRSGWRDAPWAWQARRGFEPERDDAVRDWAAGLRPAPARWSYDETSSNFLPGPDRERLRASYGEAVWERLRAIRAEWNADDVFCAGHAIPCPGE